MAKYVCPNCFEEQNLDEVEYICTNTDKNINCQNAASKIPIKPENKKKPTCDICHKPLTTMICPKCGFELPGNIGVIKNHPIAIIGAKESGKSNYVAVLINQLKNSVGSAFHAALIPTGGDKTINRYNAEFYDPVYRHKTCVKGTDEGKVEPLIYSMVFEGKKKLFSKPKGKAVSVTFFDTAGENLKSEAQMSTHNRYLCHADGIILLLDPLQLPTVRDELNGKIRLPEENEDAATILNRTISIIRNGTNNMDFARPIDIPIAIVFTKIDAVDDLIDPSSCLKNESSHIRSGYFNKLDFNDSNQEMQSLVEKWSGQELIQLVSQQFTKYAFFGLSALGSNPDYETGLIPKFRPFRVADPFLWILCEHGMIEAK